jgi:hypothetical protein
MPRSSNLAVEAEDQDDKRHDNHGPKNGNDGDAPRVAREVHVNNHGSGVAGRGPESDGGWDEGGSEQTLAYHGLLGMYKCCVWQPRWLVSRRVGGGQSAFSSFPRQRRFHAGSISAPEEISDEHKHKRDSGAEATPGELLTFCWSQTGAPLLGSDTRIDPARYIRDGSGALQGDGAGPPVTLAFGKSRPINGSGQAHRAAGCTRCGCGWLAAAAACISRG